jgi:hypothetical protein
MEKSLMGWAIDGARVFNCERGSNGGVLLSPAVIRVAIIVSGRRMLTTQKEGRSKNGPKSREETPKEGMQHAIACCSAIYIVQCTKSQSRCEGGLRSAGLSP